MYLPVNENHKISPVDNGIHKLASELYLKLYNNIYDLRTCILRLTNTIGPRMGLKMLTNIFRNMDQKFNSRHPIGSVGWGTIKRF